MKLKIFTIIFLMGLSIMKVLPQNINILKLDSLLTILLEKNKAMGSLAILKNGTFLYDKAFGYSLISDNEKKKSGINTKYRIGSISKMFTATMIFQLIEEGKLNLSTTLDTFFSNIPNAKKITVSNLLNHRSGIHSFTDDPNVGTWMGQTKTHDEILSIISKYDPDFQPNEKASYSNSNYTILGYIIEKISKQSYANNLKNRITSQIGLSNTYYGDKVSVSNDESFSYQYDGYWQQKPETDMSIPGGAGSIVSTPTDLTKFIEALFSGKLVSTNSLEKMKTMTDDYGMGMFPVVFNTKKGYSHNGGIDGYASNLAYFPKDSLAIAYCSNGQAYPFKDILVGIRSICFNVDYSIPTFSINYKAPDNLNNYLGFYLSTQIPLKNTIAKDHTMIIAQVTGQSSFSIGATENEKFKFNQKEK